MHVRGLALLFALAATASSALAAPCGDDDDCATHEVCHGAASCGTGACVPAGHLPRFVLDVPEQTAYGARIISVLDHSETFYTQCCGTEIVAYTGEVAPRGAATELCPADPNFPTCFFTPNCICGYKHPGGGSFVINGNYVGALFGPEFLSYDGHAGYDYGYGFGTPIVAPRDGQLCKAVEDFVNGHFPEPTAWDRFHTFYIDHGVSDGMGYATWYLHAASLAAPLDALAPGECSSVSGGQIVASVGNVGTFVPHLHFEARRYPPAEGPESANSQVIDPYGWRGSAPDPWENPLENSQAFAQREPLWIACGNGRIECGELCDDGNNLQGDGCAADCQSAPTPIPVLPSFLAPLLCAALVLGGLRASGRYRK